ncbi:hypothetical protein AAHB37_05370 [Glutamicibacter halophytocola]
MLCIHGTDFFPQENCQPMQPADDSLGPWIQIGALGGPLLLDACDVV